MLVAGQQAAPLAAAAAAPRGPTHLHCAAVFVACRPQLVRLLLRPHILFIQAGYKLGVCGGQPVAAIGGHRLHIVPHKLKVHKGAVGGALGWRPLLRGAGVWRFHHRCCRGRCCPATADEGPGQHAAAPPLLRRPAQTGPGRRLAQRHQRAAHQLRRHDAPKRALKYQFLGQCGNH